MKKYIEAVKWYFGMTAKDAVRYIKTSSDDTIKEILNFYCENSKKSFYED